MDILLNQARAFARTLQFRQQRLLFCPRQDDIFIVSYPRSGTTWLQMALYQLTTDGSMDFIHISQHIPWLERSMTRGRDLNALSSPRIFKSHLRYRDLPKPRTSRYIYIARDGKDVVVSYYHFYQTHLQFTGTFDEFFDRFMAGKVQGGSWFSHVAEWRRHSSDPNVLFLHYEGLVNDLPVILRKIVSFCRLQVSSDRISDILHCCTFSFMKQHESKFDHFTEIIWERNLFPVPGTFIRKGIVGTWKQYFTEQHINAFQDSLEATCPEFNSFNSPDRFS